MSPMKEQISEVAEKSSTHETEKQKDQSELLAVMMTVFGMLVLVFIAALLF